MKKEINTNNYEYVDFCLPSGTLWSTCNVGAKVPSDTGLFFQFGNSQGYTPNQVGKSKVFNWDFYKYGKHQKFTKYTKLGAKLDLEDDAAHAYMQGDWHMPSPLQIKELLDNTISTWTTLNGVNGRLFTSKSDPSKSIFFPASGIASDSSVYNNGSIGYVWSSELSTYNAGSGEYLYFDSDEVIILSNFRYSGFSVRGVISQ